VKSQVKEKPMLTLYTFGPHFGLPDASPFCIKALFLMKLSGLPHEVETMSFSKAPKGKAPYLKDGDKIIADSHFIKTYLENTHGVDFSSGYSTEDQAKAWALARMMEEHFYFLNGYERWLVDENFWKGPIQFFKSVPAPIRPLIARIVRSKVRKVQHGQGLGRHSDTERLDLAKGDLMSVETLLADKPYILGNRVSGADASVFPFIWSASSSYFNSSIGDYVRTRPILVSYLRRMRDTFFPGFDL
jgi:glutathione S-transferase